LATFFLAVFFLAAFFLAVFFLATTTFTSFFLAPSRELLGRP
jgi:hypothetical protein